MTVFIRSNLVDIINITHQQQHPSNYYFCKIKQSTEKIQHRFLLFMIMMMKMMEIEQYKCKIANKILNLTTK